MPPKASCKNKNPKCEKLKVPAFKVSINAINITSPIPSLNRLSPIIVYSVFLGTLAFVRIPNTAIGSVRDINAPKI